MFSYISISHEKLSRLIGTANAPPLRIDEDFAADPQVLRFFVLARHRKNPNGKAANAAATGTILGASFPLGKIAIGDWSAALIGIVSLAVLQSVASRCDHGHWAGCLSDPAAGMGADGTEMRW